jgi:hypothetical protein
VIIAGPQTPADMAKGVFVRGVADLSSAYASQRIKPGQRILSINGKSVGSLLINDINRLAATPVKNMVVLQVQYDPTGYAVVDGGKELAAAKKRGKPKPAEQQPSGGSGSAALAGLANSDKWFFGKVPKAVLEESLIQQGPGTFALRCMPKDPTGAVVLMINDNGSIVSFVIKFNGDGGCTFAKKPQSDVDAVIELVQSSPMTSKHGGEPYVATAPLRGGIEFNFYEFSQGTLATPQLGGGRPPPQRQQPQQQQQPGQPQQQFQQRAAPMSQKASMKQAKVQAKAALQERKRSIKVAKSEEKAAKKAGKDYEKKAEGWTCPTYPVERIAIAKRDAATFGMTFIGPEEGKPTKGVRSSPPAPLTQP